MEAGMFCFILIISSFCICSALLHQKTYDPSIFLFRKCNFDKIFQFGDSLSDTGNIAFEDPTGATNMPPYGSSYFIKPTGRSSDGLLLIDYIAMAAGLAFLRPYKEKDANFEHGVNFAVAGATAISVPDLAKRNISIPPGSTKSSLDVQINWLADYLATYCQSESDCRKKLENSLFMMGEVGGNDVNYAFWGHKTIDEIKDLVPEVVETIVKATRRIIKFGARKIVIPGNFPIGCIPAYLKMAQNENTKFDKNHCVTEYNNLADYYNRHLKQGIKKLKEENTETTIVYGDLYNAIEWLLTHALRLGFDKNSLQRACCGTGGGKYNVGGFGKFCGMPGVPACSDPEQYLNWDGVHPTQQAYMYMATWLITNMLPDLQCT